MAIDSEPRNFFGPPEVPPEVIFGRRGAKSSCTAISVRIVTLANCNKVSIKKSSADSLARNKI